eukprot:7358-Heterococcus_DN1.PRE.2
MGECRGYALSTRNGEPLTVGVRNGASCTHSLDHAVFSAAAAQPCATSQSSRAAAGTARPWRYIYVYTRKEMAGVCAALRVGCSKWRRQQHHHGAHVQCCAQRRIRTHG